MALSSHTSPVGAAGVAAATAGIEDMARLVLVAT